MADYVSSGVTSTSITLHSGDVMEVLSGGTASSTVVDSGGLLDNYGTASGTVLSLGGEQYNEPGGVSPAPTIAGGATLAAFPTGLFTLYAGVTEQVVSSGTLSDPTVSAFELLEATSSGTVAGATVGSNGFLEIISGGSDSGSTIDSGGKEFVYAGGTTTGTIVAGPFANQVAQQWVESGGVAYNTIVEGGQQQVGAGGTASSTFIESGAQEVDGTAIGAVILSGGSQQDEGTASGTIVDRGGVEQIDGTAVSTTIAAGGTATVNGVALAPTVSSAGVLQLMGGMVSSVTIDPGGELQVFGSFTVSPGQSETGIVVVSGGSEAVFGAVSNTRVQAGGTEIIYSGGVASGTILSQGIEEEGEEGSHEGPIFIPGGEQVVSSGGSAVSAVLSGGNQLIINGGTAIGTSIEENTGEGSGSVETIFGSAIGTTVSNGGADIVSSGGIASGTVLDPGGGETVAAGGSAVGTTVDRASQTTFGVSFDTIVNSGGQEWVSSGGSAVSTTISSGGGEVVWSGGTAIDPTVSSGGSALISSGGTVSSLMIAGGTVSAATGATIDGPIDFTGTGGVLQILGVTAPANTISGFAFGDAIDLTGVNYSSSGTATLMSGNVLQVKEDGLTLDFQFNSNQDFAPFHFALAPDSGAGTDIVLSGTAAVGSPPFELANSPLSLTAGTTAAITPSLLRYGDNSYGPQQETYTITSAPADGTLLLNGSPTSSFTQADIANGDVSYRETNANATADSFAFTVSDPSGATTGTEEFQFEISPNTPPFELANSPLALNADTTGTITSSLLRFGDSSYGPQQEIYTVTSAPADGTLLLNGSPTSSFTQADIASGDVSYQETNANATADSFAFMVSDPAGATTTSQEFQFQITPVPPPFELSNSPLSLDADTTEPITSSLLRYGDSSYGPQQETYSIVTAPADGTLLLNGSPTSSFTQADINNGLVSYQETNANATADSFAFTVSDPAGATTSTQQFQIEIGQSGAGDGAGNVASVMVSGVNSFDGFQVGVLSTVGPSILVSHLP